MSRQPQPQPHQRLWVVRYGTITRLVWAGSAGWAERKVRTGLTDTLANAWQVEHAPIIVKGDVFVKMATQAEVDEWHEAGGRRVEHWAG